MAGIQVTVTQALTFHLGLKTIRGKETTVWVWTNGKPLILVPIPQQVDQTVYKAWWCHPRALSPTFVPWNWNNTVVVSVCLLACLGTSTTDMLWSGSGVATITSMLFLSLLNCMTVPLVSTVSVLLDFCTYPYTLFWFALVVVNGFLHLPCSSLVTLHPSKQSLLFLCCFS